MKIDEGNVCQNTWNCHCNVEEWIKLCLLSMPMQVDSQETTHGSNVEKYKRWWIERSFASSSPVWTNFIDQRQRNRLGKVHCRLFFLVQTSSFFSSFFSQHINILIVIFCHRSHSFDWSISWMCKYKRRRREERLDKNKRELRSEPFSQFEIDAHILRKSSVFFSLFVSFAFVHQLKIRINCNLMHMYFLYLFSSRLLSVLFQSLFLSLVFSLHRRFQLNDLCVDLKNGNSF